MCDVPRQCAKHGFSLPFVRRQIMDRWPSIVAFIVVCVLSGVFAYFAWLDRNLFLIFAWFLPLAAALLGSVIERNHTSVPKSAAAWWGRRLFVFAIASVFSGWLYLPFLWNEAHRIARTKNWGPVHGVMVPGYIR